MRDHSFIGRSASVSYRALGGAVTLRRLPSSQHLNGASRTLSSREANPKIEMGALIIDFRNSDNTVAL